MHATHYIGNMYQYVSRSSAMEIKTFRFVPFTHLNKATPGFELGMEDLQSSALPLGYVAEIWECRGQIESFVRPLSIV